MSVLFLCETDAPPGTPADKVHLYNIIKMRELIWPKKQTMIFLPFSLYCTKISLYVEYQLPANFTVMCLKVHTHICMYYTYLYVQYCALFPVPPPPLPLQNQPELTELSECFVPA